MKRHLTRFSLSVLVLSGLAVIPAYAGSDLLPRPEILERMSEQASSPQEHAKVAKQYRLQALALEAKARKHEESARKLRNTPAHPMAAKWPSMVQNNWERESQLAMQARRAAQESYTQAAKHVGLAVEAEFAAE